MQLNFILFIIKSYTFLMIHQTPQSKSKILDQESQPKIPQIFLSRLKYKKNNKTILQSDSKESYEPKEVIIDAKKYHKMANMSRQSSCRSLKWSQGVRAEIDICLNAVKKVYEQQRNNQNSIYRPDQSEKSSLPVISNNSIHRVDTKIIMEYIQTIEKQYGIPNYFRQNDEYMQIIRQKMQDFSRKNPQSHYTSEMKNKKSTKKRFLHLTVSEGRPKRSSSTAVKKNNNSQNKNINLTYSPSTDNLPVINHFDIKEDNNSASKLQLCINDIKIPEQYKYCINCEEKILTSNINFHEKMQCKNLQQLYKMDYKSLKAFVHGKISKIKKSIIFNLSKLQEKKYQDQINKQKEAQFMRTIHLYIKSLQSLQGNKQKFQQAKIHYKKMGASLSKDMLFDLLTQAEKLNWFVNVYVQIDIHQNKESQGNLLQILKVPLIKEAFYREKAVNFGVLQLKAIQEFSQKQS